MVSSEGQPRDQPGGIAWGVSHGGQPGGGGVSWRGQPGWGSAWWGQLERGSAQGEISLGIGLPKGFHFPYPRSWTKVPLVL